MTSWVDPSLRRCDGGPDRARRGERARVAALRAQGRFFWLDVSLDETSRDDLAEALGVPEGALRALPGSGDATAGSRTVHADGGSVAFTLRCYVESDAGAPIACARSSRGHRRLPADPPCGAALAARGPRARLCGRSASRRYVVYSVLDAMLESTFAALDEVELTLEGLAATWATRRGRRAEERSCARRAPGSRPCGAGRRPSRPSSSDPAWRSARCGGFDAEDEPYFDRLDRRSTGCRPRSTPRRMRWGCCWICS